LGVALKLWNSEAPTYFLSDLHLGAYPSIEKTSIPLLMGFFDHICRDGARLYIVGDLLDFWFEYRTVVPRGPFRLLAKLKTMVENGCDVTYIAGNHDYWLGDFLREEVGVEICADTMDVAINGKRFFISHGDGIATDGNLGYRVIKGILHSKIVSGAFRMVHPDLGIRMARLLSRVSRRRSSRNNNDPRPELEAFVKSKSESGFDFVVLGHLHKPKMFEVNGTSCLVIGDWIDYFTYGLFADGKLTLEKWPPPHPRPT
jgi:UDP-2,3-diacylglucosamine hydrolase